MEQQWQDFCAYFIPDRAYFGGFPSEEQLMILKDKLGVSHIVDLTVPDEVYPKYTKDGISYLNFPIEDRKVPQDTCAFSALVLKLHRLLTSENSSTLYVHCRGGHGRAGLLVAILLHLYIGNISSQNAIEMTTKFHNTRRKMKQKWRAIGSPQTRQQKTFVHKFFSTLVFFRAYRKGPTHGFSNYSFHPIVVPKGLLNIPDGTFPSSEATFQASKDLTNKLYVQKHRQSKNPRISRKIGEKHTAKADWENQRFSIMSNIVSLKIDQHEEIKRNLQRSCLKNIIYNSRTDGFFGCGSRGDGKNLLGKILMNVRNELYNNITPEFILKKEDEEEDEEKIKNVREKVGKVGKVGKEEEVAVCI